MLKLDKYQTLVFDCDGVLLDSNKVKTDAFHRAAESYGRDSARKLVEYHVNNGGISRYAKFEFFLEHIVGRAEIDPAELELLLGRYASGVQQGLATCAIADGLERLRAQTRQSRWLVVSGGDQSELRELFKKRGLSVLFDGGIHGSPATKDELLSKLMENGAIQGPALFLGDSQYDYEAATRAGLDFVFVSAWSESHFDFGGAHAQIKVLADLLQP